MQYAQTNKRNSDRDQSSEDPTRVQYASIDEQQLVPISEDIHVQDDPGVCTDVRNAMNLINNNGHYSMLL